jgi:hypothetical protein
MIYTGEKYEIFYFPHLFQNKFRTFFKKMPTPVLINSYYFAYLVYLKIICTLFQWFTEDLFLLSAHSIVPRCS